LSLASGPLAKIGGEPSLPRGYLGVRYVTTVQSGSDQARSRTGCCR
jgi:hypothetical protein